MTDGDYNTEYTADGINGSPGAGSTPANASSACRPKNSARPRRTKASKFMVGFQVSSNAANLLKKCATDPLWFYDAKSPEQLAQSYRDIALKLSALYLAK